jgi:tetratricopeptide (TPR) repeat protein
MSNIYFQTNKLRFFILIILVLLLLGCAYFNTFYNAQNYYREGKKSITHDTLKVSSEYFDKTIEKSIMVIVKHPNCRWVDDALFLMGSSYYYMGDYPRAHEKLDFLILNYPESHFYDDALYYKGLTYFKQDKLAQAVISLKEAMESKYYRKKSMIALCYVYYKDGNYASLTEMAQRLLDESLNNTEKREVLGLLAEAQFNQKLYHEALNSYHNLLSITREEEAKHDLKLNIAMTYLEIDEYEKCRNFLAGEYESEFRILLADLNIKTDNIEEAMEIYHEVTQIDFSDYATQAYYKLAELYENEDSLERAISYYDSSLNISPTSEYGEKAKKKADVLNRILELTNETEEIDRAQFHLAEMYFVDLNEPERAIEEYQKVYTDFPESIWAPKALYAQFWITKNFLNEDSVATLLAQNLMSRYPNTEYAMSAKKMIQKEINE